MFWFFSCEACGIFALQPGIKLTLLAQEGEILTTGPPVKSLFWSLNTTCSLKLMYP